MNKQVIAGFAAEGNTDFRFLGSIIQRTIEDVATECTGQVEVLPLQHIKKLNGPFNDMVNEYSKKAHDLGVMILCIHTDADATSDTPVFQNKINPAFGAVLSSPDSVCKNLVAVAPVQMMEAWILADKILLRNV